MDLKLNSASLVALATYDDAAIVLEVVMTLPLSLLMSSLRRIYKDRLVGEYLNCV